MVIQTLMPMPSLHGLKKSIFSYRQPGLKRIGIWFALSKVLVSIPNIVHNPEDHIRAKTTNVLEKVYVENIRIKDFYENPNGNDTLVVILSSTLRDYVIDDETRKVIEGDPQQDLFTVYQMNFIRKHGSQTENNVQDEAVSDHCPNCGAPLKISAISQCEYCGAELTRSPNQWVLDTYDVVDEDELYN